MPAEHRRAVRVALHSAMFRRDARGHAACPARAMAIVLASPAARPLRHPLRFALCTLRAFRANQGLLLAGAVAYYALLSIVPLLILIVIALSHMVEPSELLATRGWNSA